MMFGFGGIKMALLGGAAIAFLGMAGTIWYLNKQNNTLHENNAKLEVSLEAEKSAVQAAKDNATEWKENSEQITGLNEQMAGLRLDLKKQEKKLENLFEKHDLEKLALAKPGLVETRVNRATANTFSLLTRATSLSGYEASGAGETPR